MSQPIKSFDIVRVTSVRKIDLKSKEKDTQWILQLTAPVTIVAQNPGKTLGEPGDFFMMDPMNSKTQPVAIPESAQNPIPDHTGL